ncbi:hypothetical protein SAMN04489724_0535 [Algoriphagus locisalis]|uniref:Uncharacterized protein n=1 Tax=Algoriphagus locisalis TaxID=305507 RepID=A0A1I6XL01_9BACT|nr:hypothetical protein [Algoriphagus locisalis]SFT38777.1 hypothetical protein SAMN04489724_0535 [Algoriphagus locisalis]
MKFFYLSSNPNENGLHEVHDRECEHIPSSYDRDYLGPYNTGKEAMRKALDYKKEVALCEVCCKSRERSLIDN